MFARASDPFATASFEPSFERPTPSRRRYPRLHLDVDWIIESEADGAWGRGLVASLRSVRLPLHESHRMLGRMTLWMALPGRARMFRARVHPVASKRLGAFQFMDVAVPELTLLADALMEVHGLQVLPPLARRFRRFADLPLRGLGIST